MTVSDPDLVRKWLEFSNEDLEVAAVAIDGGMLRPALYHCQQAAEKALKGMIAARGKMPPAIHNLPVLLARTGLEGLGEDAEQLNEYSVGPRYPTKETSSDYSREETRAALEAARRIVAAVEEALAGEL